MIPELLNSRSPHILIALSRDGRKEHNLDFAAALLRSQRVAWL